MKMTPIEKLTLAGIILSFSLCLGLLIAIIAWP